MVGDTGLHCHCQGRPRMPVCHCESWFHSRRVLGTTEFVRAGWPALSLKNRCGPRVLVYFAAGIVVCRCLQPIVDLVQHDKQACLLSFSIPICPSRGLRAWFPRYLVLCHGSSWMWIWQPCVGPVPVAGCPSGYMGPKHRLHTSGWVWPWRCR